VNYCKACDAPVDWVLTEARRRMPVDVEPCEDGNLVKTHSIRTTRGFMAVVRVLKAGEATGLTRYRAHFATCPQAGALRRTRARSQ
jgi:hypothetical protein